MGIGHVLRRGILAVALSFAGGAVWAQTSAPVQGAALGCRAIVAHVAETGRVALPGVRFDFNRATLRPESLPTLIAARDAIRALGGDWTVEGHTDAIGSHDYNQRLSLQRAQAVADWLSGAGVAGARLEVRGFAFDRPIADNATDEGRARNRRVELLAHNPDFDAMGFGGPAGDGGCAETAPADATAADLPPPTGFQGVGGRDWLEFSGLQPSGRGTAGFESFETVALPAGTLPQTCQAMCLAESGCAAWSFQPGGAYFIAEASCMRYDYGAELALERHNDYQADGGIFVSGFRPDATNLTPETAPLADEIVADMAQIAAARAATRLDAPQVVVAGEPLAVGVTGWVLDGDFVEIADFDEWTFYYEGIHARATHAERDGAGRVTLIAPQPGDYVLRYVIDHPRAGRHSIAEQPILVRADAPPPAPAAPPPVPPAPASPASGLGTVEPGIDRPGFDLGQTPLPSADPLACQALCAGDAACRAWTYVAPAQQGEEAMCWTKFDVPDGHPNACCTSGVMQAAAVPAPEPAVGIALDGPARVQAGGSLWVSWSVVEDPGDWVTVVPAGAEDGTWTEYRYVGFNLRDTLTAPEEPGLYELRYVRSADGATRGRRSVEVVAPETEVKAGPAP